MNPNSPLLLALFTSLLGCEEPVCMPEPLETAQLEDLYGCVNTPYQMNIDLDNSFEIIRDTTAFQQWVSGNCLAPIDFGKYDLIIGKQFLTNGVSDIAYQYFRRCTPDIYLLEVRIALNATTEAPNVTYHTLIPKLAEQERVKVEVIIQN